MKVAIVMAMPEEAAALLKALPFQPVPETSDQKLFQASIYRHSKPNAEFFVSVNTPMNGLAQIGCVPAALNTAYVLKFIQPDLVISAGTCGGFQKRGAEIGDVYASSAIHFHDRRISLSRFKEWAERDWQNYDTKKIAEKMGLKRGIVTTGDSFDPNDSDSEAMEKWQTHCKEMEAAAVGTVCARTGTKYFALKSVTDLVDKTEESPLVQFLKNLERASQNLSHTLTRLIESPHEFLN